ncbi:MAG: DMT family transporter, partial [Actinobacteria bacterium]|nr:DMT family transporter [Actinomycetota bacterium]
SEPLAQGAWVALGAAASSLAHGAVTSNLVAPGRQWAVLALYGLATASAFTFMFAALARLGPSRTAVALTLEAFSAVALGAVFLDETLAPSQLVGGLAILAATVTIARSRRHAAPAPPEAPVPPADSPGPPATSASSDNLGR